jgi:hypothetical protein
MAASKGFDAYQHETGGPVWVEKFELLRVRSEIAVASTYRLRGLGSDAEICLSLTRKYAKGVSSRTDKQWHKSLSVCGFQLGQEAASIDLREGPLAIDVNDCCWHFPGMAVVSVNVRLRESPDIEFECVDEKCDLGPQRGE